MKRIGLAVALCLGLLATASAALGAAPQNQNAIPLDPDILAKQANDANWSLMWLGKGHYRLLVQNTSGVGYIDTFDWVAGVGMNVTSIISTSGGKCTVEARVIACVGKIKPPRCTCLPGGSMTIDFTATAPGSTDPNGVRNNTGDEGSTLAIKSFTPVPYHIPSSLNSDT